MEGTIMLARNFIIIILIGLMILPCINVTAWYENEEIDNNWDHTYMNVKFGSEEMYSLGIDKVTVKPNFIHNLEPGMIICFNDGGEYIDKRSAEDGTIIWSRSSGDGLGNIGNVLGFFYAIDSSNNIYIQADGKLVKLNGQDGKTMWSTSNMNNINVIDGMWINQHNSKILIRTNGGNYAIFYTADGDRLASSTAPGTTYDAVWTHDDRIIFFEDDQITIRDVYFFEVEDYPGIYNSALYAYERIEFPAVYYENDTIPEPYYSEFLFCNDLSKVDIYRFKDDTLTYLCNYTTVNGSHGDMCYSSKVDKLLIQHTDSQLSTGPSSVIMLNWVKEDPTNITLAWESSQQDNNHAPMGYAIMDSEGFVIWNRYGMGTVLRLDAINGATIQTYTASPYELYAPNINSAYGFNNYPMIYDSKYETFIVTSIESASYSHLTWAKYNSSSVNGGGNEDPIFPDEITEDNWTWIFFTFAIISLAAVCAFIGGYIFNSSVFLMVFAVLISIGAWYGIYPVQALLFSVLLLGTIFIKNRGDSFE